MVGNTKFIADIGINHDGDVIKALVLIKNAKEIGIDYVKFQKRTPRVCVPKSQWDNIKDSIFGKMRYIDYKEKMELSKEDYKIINSYCKIMKIKWSASVWDIDSFKFINSFGSTVPFIKISSASITDIPLLTEVSKTEKSIIMSIGMSTMEDVNNAMKIFKNNDVTILHCNSSYPAKENELDLNFIKTLKELYPKCKIGYSGHEEGFVPSVVAFTLDVDFIERHITYNKQAKGTDHSSSLDVNDFKNLINSCKQVNTILGKSELHVYPTEEINRNKLRIK